MVKRLDFFFERYNKCFSSETFFVFVKSYSISSACHGKGFAPAGFFFKLSIDHLFHNLESGKRNYCFGKSLEKVVNFGSQIRTNPVLTMYVPE